MASPDAAAARPLTDFEQVLLGVITDEPRSGYGLKKLFNTTPASVYQPSPGALYPALRRLEHRGLLRVEEKVSSGRRKRRLYHATAAGRAAHLDWLREPVAADSIARDLGLHLMRFMMMENRLTRGDVLTFLKHLADALGRFIAGMEEYAAAVADRRSSGRHGLLALEHGIAVHRASLDWARSTMTALAEPDDDRSRPAG